MTIEEIEINLQKLASNYPITIVEIIAVCDSQLILLQNKETLSLLDGFVGNESILGAAFRITKSLSGGIIQNIHSQAINAFSYLLPSGKEAAWFTILVQIKIKNAKKNVIKLSLDQFMDHLKIPTVKVSKNIQKRITAVYPLIRDFYRDDERITHMEEAEKACGSMEQEASHILLQLKEAPQTPQKDGVFKRPHPPKKKEATGRAAKRRKEDVRLTAIKEVFTDPTDWCGSGYSSDEIEGFTFYSGFGK